ncbi:hypothetical protein [Neobacillus sp. DY30]|uniref:hypothetical protein n=1 Tax=Neobacillus sp. DY30 TaxID=3047871 RepID=UPI0024C06CE6|nr:hypothetical protein [Neobacillus sp. DY30]WHY01691.1 hypothetical protein QNH29_05445 [Neobacillus sp. DY30]
MSYYLSTLHFSLSDCKIKDLKTKKTELNEKLKESDNQDFAINIGTKLKDVPNLKELMPQVLHSLVEKVICRMMAPSTFNTALLIHCKTHNRQHPVGLVAFL